MGGTGGAGGESTALAAGATHGFAPALTSFVGRVKDTEALAGLLGRHRLVTVAGPGGAGKSRLAAEVAARAAIQFADGAWLVELAGVRDPALVPGVVAAALGIPEQAGLPAADALARVLATQQLLIVLDNCEQVIGAAAGLCAGLLAACDDVRLLTTSQEPLRVAGEARYRLGPLALPGPDDAAGADCEAAVLFADRARNADARFELDEGTRPAVARLVRRLDGMPLAIELAAAQVESLGVTQLLDRIDDRFSLLAGADRLAPSRQQSLAATVEWSYRLLDEQEQRVFRLVSVFPGPFTLGAAETVAGDGASKALLRLVDCSLVVPPRPGPDGEPRYSMLETLRTYGTSRLAEAGEQPAAAGALAGYALRAAEQAASGLETRTAEVAAARLLDAEDATMQQALAWSTKHDPATGVRLALALAPWWFLRGRLASESPLLRQAAGHPAAGSDAWCAAQFWLGYTALHSADLPGALDRFTALRDARQDSASPALAAGLAGRSLALTYLGRLAEAAEDGRRSLEVAWTADDPTGQVRALVNLSSAAYAAGDIEEAARLAWQAEQIPAEVPGAIARAGSNILTMALTALGDLAAAERVCAAGLARSRAAGDLWSLARLLTQLAVLDVRADRTGDAAAHLGEALQAAWRIGGHAEILGALDGCGHLCAATGRPAEAVTVWTARAALARREGHADRPPAARRRREPLADVTKALTIAQVSAAEERGAAMSLGTAVEYGLMLTTAPSPPPGPEPSPLGHLSARERELVTLVAHGNTDMQIAAQLFISVSTVRSHLDRIRDKTDCRRRADLTRLALGAGLV